jgi:hypothetical protein
MDSRVEPGKDVLAYNRSMILTGVCKPVVKGTRVGSPFSAAMVMTAIAQRGARVVNRRAVVFLAYPGQRGLRRNGTFHRIKTDSPGLRGKPLIQWNVNRPGTPRR